MDEKTLADLMATTGTVLIRAESLEQDTLESQPWGYRLQADATAQGMRQAAEMFLLLIAEHGRGSIETMRVRCVEVARNMMMTAQDRRTGEQDPELRHELVTLQTKILSGHGDERDRARVRAIEAQLHPGDPDHQPRRPDFSGG